MKFEKWFMVFCEEKGISLESLREVEVNGNTHIINYGTLVHFFDGGLDSQTKDTIKKTIIKLDFLNNTKEIFNYLDFLLKGYVRAMGY